MQPLKLTIKKVTSYGDGHDGRGPIITTDIVAEGDGAELKISYSGRPRHHVGAKLEVALPDAVIVE